MSWSAIVEDFSKNWWLYASMPVVAAVIGYTTKLVARSQESRGGKAG